MTLIEQKIHKILVFQLGCKPEEITRETNISTEFDPDSLDCLEICMDLEDSLNLTISEEEFENIKTFKELVDLLTPRVGKG